MEKIHQALFVAVAILVITLFIVNSLHSLQIKTEEDFITEMIQQVNEASYGDQYI